LLNRLTAERDRHAERSRVLALVRSRVNQWHMELRLPAGCAVESVPPIDTELKPGETLNEAISKVRTKIAGVQKEMVAVRQAPLRKSSQQDAISQYLAAQVGRVKPRVAFDARGRATVTWGEDMVVGKSDILALLPWILNGASKQVLAAFMRDLGDEPEAANAVTPVEREAKLGELGAALLSLERREAALLNGTDTILPRPDVDPRAYLGVVVRTQTPTPPQAKEAAVPAA
jgi:hypothetical protein